MHSPALTANAPVRKTKAGVFDKASLAGYPLYAWWRH